MQVVFKKQYMIVYKRYETEYIVYNIRKPWEEGHTHVRSYKQASYLVDLELNKKVPKRVNKYFIISLMRITKDKKYIKSLEKKLNGMSKNKPPYYNTPYFNKTK